MGRWKALAVLGTAQFLMVLDTSVMNVSISQLVADFDTEVTAIQATITLYTLVMAAFMITGGKLGDLWGRLAPRNSPVTIFGFSLTPFVIAAGAVLLALFRGWQRHREARQRDPLVRFSLFGIPPLRSSLSMLLAQNLVLLGVFFAIPLYLQIVQGFNAFQTGLRLLPVSLTIRRRAVGTASAGP